MISLCEIGSSSLFLPPYPVDTGENDRWSDCFAAKQESTNK
jgi:hypothetical protein